ncbi:MAG: PAS domain-containing protein [bacterium]|nr:PAS domain-containing protein [bacterium]
MTRRQAFGALLTSFDLEALARLPDTIYGVDADLRLAMFNPAWFAFAAANGGLPDVARDWGLGRSVLDACPSVVRDFYARSLAAALRLDRHRDHEYECSSPGVRRRMRMSAYPLRDGAGLLVVNALIIETPRATAALTSHDLCDICLDFYYPAPVEPPVAG